MSDWRSEQEDKVFGEAEAGSPREALERSRVDLVSLIRDGIPDREYVPGTGGLIPRKKRLHVAAEAKTGKTISLAVIGSVDIVMAGGTVVVLDRENGADEFARRLSDVLDAREAGEDARELVKARLRYHAWPLLRMDWRDDPAYPEAFAGVDVVIFDSTRSHLTPLGLQENTSDDFAAFTDALIDPLMKAGISTVTLDNVGHGEKDRSRGTSAKSDLCDIALTLKATAPFSTTVEGLLQIRCTHSRIGEISVGDTWRMKLGCGHYGAWERSEKTEGATRSAFRPTNIMEKVSRAIEDTPGLSRNAIITTLGKKKEHTVLALELLAAEGFIEVRKDGQAHPHHSARAYRESEDSPTGSTGSQLGPNWVPDPVLATGSHRVPTGPTARGAWDPVSGDPGPAETSQPGPDLFHDPSMKVA